MARKTGWKKVSPPDFSSFADELVAVPRNFVFGVVAGLLVPVAAIAGVVAGIYLFTRKVPFVTEIRESDDERQLILELVEPEEARSLFQRGREAVQAFGDEIRGELESEE
jgi:hypothetical protein